MNIENKMWKASLIKFCLHSRPSAKGERFIFCVWRKASLFARVFFGTVGFGRMDRLQSRILSRRKEFPIRDMLKMSEKSKFSMTILIKCNWISTLTLIGLLEHTIRKFVCIYVSFATSCSNYILGTSTSYNFGRNKSVIMSRFGRQINILRKFWDILYKLLCYLAKARS